MAKFKFRIFSLSKGKKKKIGKWQNFPIFQRRKKIKFGNIRGSPLSLGLGRGFIEKFKFKFSEMKKINK